MTGKFLGNFLFYMQGGESGMGFKNILGNKLVFSWLFYNKNNLLTEQA